MLLSKNSIKKIFSKFKNKEMYCITYGKILLTNGKNVIVTCSNEECKTCKILKNI